LGSDKTGVGGSTALLVKFFVNIYLPPPSGILTALVKCLLRFAQYFSNNLRTVAMVTGVVGTPQPPKYGQHFPTNVAVLFHTGKFSHFTKDAK